MKSPYAGTLYRPSNGTSGEIFRHNWCDQCEKDRYESKPCGIFTRTLIHDVDEKRYPKEWNYDDEGRPQCTAFVKRGSVSRSARSARIRDKRQEGLPI